MRCSACRRPRSADPLCLVYRQVANEPSRRWHAWAPWPELATAAPSLTAKPAQRGRPKGDRSLECPAWEPGSFRLAAPTDGAPEGELRGRVKTLRPAKDAKPGVVEITAADATVTALALTGPGKPMLAVGDEVTVKWREQRIGIHHVSSLGVIDGDRRTTYATAGDGDAIFAPGWFVEVGEVAELDEPHTEGGARRETRWLLLGVGDDAAFVREGDAARRLTTSGTEYCLDGGAVGWTDGLRVPDSSSYHSFTIVRFK